MINLPIEEEPGLPKAKLPTYLGQQYHHLEPVNLHTEQGESAIDNIRNSKT